jgi:hypothetical protein
MLGKPLVRFCEGSGYNSGHGRDIVAPLGNQAANRENKLRPKVWGVPDLLENLRQRESRARLNGCIAPDRVTQPWRFVT